MSCRSWHQSVQGDSAKGGGEGLLILAPGRNRRVVAAVRSQGEWHSLLHLGSLRLGLLEGMRLLLHRSLRRGPWTGPHLDSSSPRIEEGGPSDAANTACVGRQWSLSTGPSVTGRRRSAVGARWFATALVPAALGAPLAAIGFAALALRVGGLLRWPR